jgi:hypothetical protein
MFIVWKFLVTELYKCMAYDGNQYSPGGSAFTFAFLSGTVNIESSWLVCCVVLIILATVEMASNP